jgi:hypothetical protein
VGPIESRRHRRAQDADRPGPRHSHPESPWRPHHAFAVVLAGKDASEGVDQMRSRRPPRVGKRLSSPSQKVYSRGVTISRGVTFTFNWESFPPSHGDNGTSAGGLSVGILPAGGLKLALDPDMISVTLDLQMPWHKEH